MSWWEPLLVFVGSFVAGYLGSALGLVLGTLRLPVLLVAAGSASSGGGTNIAISAVAAASGGHRHAREGRVDWSIVAWMAPPSVVGAVVGGLFAHRLPESVLLAAVSAVLLWQGVDLAVRPFVRSAEGRPRYSPAVVFGLVIGLVGGALGVILGTLRMPALLRAVRLDVRRAIGTNLVVGFFLGVAGFAAHAAELDVDWVLLPFGIAGAVPGAWLGAKATGRLSETFLRRAIGVALVAVGIAFAVEAGLRS
jgi:uncharacterized membrane protein YfcA